MHLRATILRMMGRMFDCLLQKQENALPSPAGQPDLAVNPL
jgi:hypothetical protein